MGFVLGRELKRRKAPRPGAAGAAQATTTVGASVGRNSDRSCLGTAARPLVRAVAALTRRQNWCCLLIATLESLVLCVLYAWASGHAVGCLFGVVCDVGGGAACKLCMSCPLRRLAARRDLAEHFASVFSAPRTHAHGDVRLRVEC